MLDTRHSVFAVLNVAHDEEEDPEDMEEAEGNKAVFGFLLAFFSKSLTYLESILLFPKEVCN